MCDSYNKKRVEEIINTNINILNKFEINKLRTELNDIINWWSVTPVSELRIIGIFWLYQKMLDKRDEMLTALKSKGTLI